MLPLPDRGDVRRSAGAARRQGSGAALREGWRFLVGTVAVPLAKLVAGQLGEALGEPALRLDMRKALAAERMVQALAAAKLAGVEGVDFDQARELVGL